MLFFAHLHGEVETGEWPLQDVTNKSQAFLFFFLSLSFFLFLSFVLNMLGLGCNAGLGLLVYLSRCPVCLMVRPTMSTTNPGQVNISLVTLLNVRYFGGIFPPNVAIFGKLIVRVHMLYSLILIQLGYVFTHSKVVPMFNAPKFKVQFK